MHAISSYRGNRPTNKQTQPQTHRQDRLQYTAPQLARSVTILTEEEEHSGVLSVAEVDKFSVMSRGDNFAEKSDQREEHLEESFPLPAARCHRAAGAVDEVQREGHR